ncbi:uncharacterized protein LOC100680524 isoform X2 [Nasonia vitripennis]|uniref:RIIa domain-containing protein n=1 Tax=Nasonia vitripennis TaxID=7425 RepID=A0A7M7Q3A8_NASVI|nr:uncharacterized protein LOC100680524 isoform X2 [Nasonia vitripennis]
MDVMLHNHKAKNVCDIPDGLRELCADISREVIRSQPMDIYDFIANYLDTLMVTRENAKVAMKVVQNIMLKSEQIVEILSGTGLKLKEIAAAAPRLQKAFRAYLDAVDGQRKECGCDDDSDIDDECEISICRILKETGATFEEAHCAAIKIQALFRGHYERMSLAEKRGEVQWQRAAVNTMEILRKSGVSRSEASHAAVTIQAAYRGYYTRKNLQMNKYLQEKEGHTDLDDQIDMSAWLDMMFENHGLTVERANEAAIIIQTAYRRYRERKHPRSEFTSSSKISSSIEREKLDSLDEVVISASKESDRKQEKIGQLQTESSDDDDSEIGIRAVKFPSTISGHSEDSTEIREASFENDDQTLTLIEALEEEELKKDDGKEEIEKVPSTSDSAGKIRFADQEEHEDENHTVEDTVEDEVENEQTET